MRIYFYPECNFNINKAKTYDVTSLAEWFDSQHKNPDDYEIVGKDGESHDSAYEAEVCAVYPRIMGGKSKGKNILKVVVGLALVLATGGTTAALFSNIGGLSMAHTLGAGLLLSGGGALLMGKMKMPSMDLSSDSATKENYQWNVGNLSTSRGVKGVTFGSDVIPEGELLAYRTYGTNSIEKVVRSSKAAGWYYQGDYNKTYAKKISGIMGDYYKWLPGYTEYASVSTDSSSYLEMLIGCGEGELDSITDIKINDISVSDLEMVQDVDYAIRLGSNTQTALKQTDLDSQAGYQSIGQAVPVKLNGSVTPLLITTPSACDSCCIAFQVPNWYMYDTSSGAKNSAFIKLKIGYRTSGSSGSYTYLTKTGIAEIDNTTALKSESAFYFQVVIKFPSNGTYQISIENDSAELNNAKGLLSAAEYSGSALPDRAAINISVDNIACYNNKEQTYPNTALIWLRIPASQTLNGSMPKVTWKQARASIYAHNGSSYVTKPADNLAWAIYDIIAQVRKDGNTYHNEGEDVANIDFDKFVAFASFCDSIGAKGNWFLNKLDTSWSNAMSVATSCRAFIGLRSGKVCPYWDAPTEMTQIFTVGNYEDMSGVITAKKDRAKAIEATFNNEEEKFASRTVRVEIDNDHSAEAVSMTFAGLSNPVNVSKQAHYILRRNKYLVQSVKFTADIDSIVCELNDVIGVQCDLTEYGVGGRIFKVENNVISLDAPVTLTSGNSYALLVRHTDGTLERKTPVETNGTFTQLTFNSAWSKPVLKGDVYSFGIANSEVRKYRVTGIARTNDLKAQIEAIEYNENVYDELAVAPYTYTNPNAGINNVTTTYTPEAVELAWDANNNTSYVNVYVDGVFYGRYQNGAQIPNINSEQLIEMFPVNEYGEEDTPVVRTISNNLPTPSTPPVPIVQSTTTGCVAEFDGIPKNENIVWLIIKEGDNELGRVNILGEYMSVSIQLRSGTHTLSAYFVNQFSKSSQARTFTATPLGDIQANDISATALKLPTGSILRLSAKNCTTASISEANGVKDVSGRGNHGRAYGGVTVLDGGEGFGFSGANKSRFLFENSTLLSKINGNTEITISLRAKNTNVNYKRICMLTSDSYVFGGFVLVDSTTISYQDRLNNRNETIKTLTATTTVSEEHMYTVSIDYSNGVIILFIDGEEAARNDDWLTGTKNNVSNLTFGAYSAGSVDQYCFDGTVRDIRIYPRALSASEVKTIYMFPDDVTFGQLTADLIGANIIKASNLVYTENIITQTAQIKDAIITNAKIADLNASKINAGTLDAARIAANAITAEKLNVEAVRIPKGESFYVTANGLPNPMAAGSAVPDLSNYYSGKTYNGVLGHSTINVLGGGHAFRWSALTDKTIIAFSGSGLTIGNSFTISFWIYCEDFSQNPDFVDIQNTTFGTNNNSSRIWVGANADSNGNGTLRFVVYNGTTAVELNSGTINKNTWYHLVFRLNSGTGICFRNGVSFGSSKTMTHSDLTANCITIGGFMNNPSSRAFKGYIGEVKIFRRSLTEQEIMTLFHNGLNSESGQITADRIATDAIKSRNFSGSTDGSAFSTYGSYLDLANGNFVTPFFRLRSNSTNKDCQIGNYKINSNGFFSASVTSGVVKSDMLLAAQLIYLQNSTTDSSVGTKTASMAHYYLEINNQQTDNVFYVNTDNTGAAYSSAVVKITPQSTSKYGLYVAGKARINTADYGSDEKTKKDFQDVSTLDKLKKLRVCAWRFDEEKLIEKQNLDIDKENIKIEAENKAIDAENAEIEKENEKRKNRKDGETVELIPLKEHKKLREHKIADKNANHPLNIGCMAGEFNKAFGTNDGSEDCLSVTDTIGVCMRAIQELAEQFDNAVLEIKELKNLLKQKEEETR